MPNALLIFLNSFQNDPFVQIAAIYGASYQASQSGLYYAIVHSGKCTGQGPHKSVTVQESIDLHFPNVFTPNGDGVNDEFKIASGPEHLHYRITNRYGKQIFSGTNHTPWTGDNAPSGVYFWSATYQTCEGLTRTAKGFVHLLK